MPTETTTTSVLGIGECGYDEAWLQNVIYEDPSILGLGELQAVMKELSQPQGGRLDLLLKDPEDDSMFEVELQLGSTDESHIIRTVEYWDKAKMMWPRRSHTAVLVAEEITNRFINVVHLLSMAVPMIGIQVNMVQIGDARALHFSKVIDSYTEPEDTEPTQATYDERHWVDNYPGTLECARWYRDLLKRYYGDVPVKFFDTYISFSVGGIARVWVNRRKNDRALFEVKCADQDRNAVVDHLNSEGIAVGVRRSGLFSFNVNLQQLKDQQRAHEWLAQQLAPGHLVKVLP